MPGTQGGEATELKNEQFLLAEYHEAATSYANGVEIGFSTTKAFFAINGVLVTVHQTPLELVNNSEIMQYLQSLTPVFGLLVSFILALFISPYYRHLNNCLERCVQIEKMFDGALFSGNKKIAYRRVNTSAVLYLFSLSALAAWAFQLYRSLG